MMKILNNNRLRYALSMVVAIMLSFILAFLFSRKNMWLIPLIAVYAMQTSIGNSLYQGVRKLFVIFVVVLIAALCVRSMEFFILAMKDVLLGVALGVVANLLIFPRKADVAFRQAIAPILIAYQNYLQQLMTAVRHSSEISNNVEFEKAILQLPGWVLEMGFDLGLQVGYQFFLVKLEQIADVLLALHYLARFKYGEDLLHAVDEELLQCQEKFNGFFTALIQVLQLKKLNEDVQDFTLELDALEKQFYQVAPPSLELLDIRLDYVYFAELIFCLRDLHQYLMRLGEALR